MPELPEVETVMRGLERHIIGALIQDVVVRRPKLRWPIPQALKDNLFQQKIIALSRRGKYLLVHVETGTLIMHLGMSGRLRIVTHSTPLESHDHVDIIFSNQTILRYNDPRRFGAILWTTDDPNNHPLLKSLGPEPFDSRFTASHLEKCAKSRRIAVKSFVMDSKVVVGVGNIYAAEALFLAHIHPEAPANSLTLSQHQQLVEAIQNILSAAIKQGGTTVKDFVNSNGKPGYFTQQLSVYGRAGLPCIRCKTPLHYIKQGGRSTVFCAQCQKYDDSQ